MGAVQPLGDLLAAELADKLDAPGLRIEFQPVVRKRPIRPGAGVRLAGQGRTGDGAGGEVGGAVDVTRLPARLLSAVELARRDELFCLPDDDLGRAVSDLHFFLETLYAERFRREVAEAARDMRESRRSPLGVADSERQE